MAPDPAGSEDVMTSSTSVTGRTSAGESIALQRGEEGTRAAVRCHSGLRPGEEGGGTA